MATGCWLVTLACWNSPRALAAPWNGYLLPGLWYVLRYSIWAGPRFFHHVISFCWLCQAISDSPSSSWMFSPNKSLTELMRNQFYRQYRCYGTSIQLGSCDSLNETNNILFPSKMPQKAFAFLFRATNINGPHFVLFYFKKTRGQHKGLHTWKRKKMFLVLKK